ncbi:MAG: hypothetical protein WBP81_12210 [Solirubrobacteraceae bacterium]
MPEGQATAGSGLVLETLDLIGGFAGRELPDRLLVGRRAVGALR